MAKLTKKEVSSLPKKAFALGDKGLPLAQPNKSCSKWEYSKTRIASAIRKAKSAYEKDLISKSKCNKILKEAKEAKEKLGKKYACLKGKKLGLKKKKNPWTNREILEFIESNLGDIKMKEIVLRSRGSDGKIDRNELIRQVGILSSSSNDSDLKELYNELKREVSLANIMSRSKSMPTISGIKRSRSTHNLGRFSEFEDILKPTQKKPSKKTTEKRKLERLLRDLELERLTS